MYSILYYNTLIWFKTVVLHQASYASCLSSPLPGLVWWAHIQLAKEGMVMEICLSVYSVTVLSHLENNLNPESDP